MVEEARWGRESLFSDESWGFLQIFLTAPTFVNDHGSGGEIEYISSGEETCEGIPKRLEAISKHTSLVHDVN